MSMNYGVDKRISELMLIFLVKQKQKSYSSTRYLKDACISQVLVFCLKSHQELTQNKIRKIYYWEEIYFRIRPKSKF